MLAIQINGLPCWFNVMAASAYLLEKIQVYLIKQVTNTNSI